MFQRLDTTSLQNKILDEKLQKFDDSYSTNKAIFDMIRNNIDLQALHANRDKQWKIETLMKKLTSYNIKESPELSNILDSLNINGQISEVSIMKLISWDFLYEFDANEMN